MVTTAHLEPIPHPPGHLLVGNLFDLDTSHPLESLADLARQYGPIYQLQLPGRGSRVIVSGYELVDELCDETRFDKMLGPGLSILGEGPVGRGLFTSETSDPKWQKAHNVLLPAFSLDAMRSYFGGMLDLAVQLIQKWGRLNPDDTVDVPADVTRLTLDTIALCGFNYRFNSFYRDTPQQCSAATSSTASSAASSASPTTPAATGTVRSARVSRVCNGWPTAGPSSCPCPTSTLSSPCRRRSPRSL